jgi:hypothetical protein
MLILADQKSTQDNVDSASFVQGQPRNITTPDYIGMVATQHHEFKHSALGSSHG